MGRYHYWHQLTGGLGLGQKNRAGFSSGIWSRVIAGVQEGTVGQPAASATLGRKPRTASGYPEHPPPPPRGLKHNRHSWGKEKAGVPVWHGSCVSTLLSVHAAQPRARLCRVSGAPLGPRANVEGTQAPSKVPFSRSVL
ncbi:hypothetical protein JZ751_014731 [Albula glossodonta]|uniref:Uncharacterized protein n=1 Tax=Albula glossodonta TaxID=121402 RepID=A0A8T2MY28_9TELE|nr:hypothetical protein JZ751_014731 [Albula glossodonta]